MRHVTLDPIDGTAVPAIEKDPQASMVAKLDRESERLRRFRWVPWIMAIIPSLFLASLIARAWIKL
jgi:hypothetical protein